MIPTTLAIIVIINDFPAAIWEPWKGFQVSGYPASVVVNLSLFLQLPVTLSQLTPCGGLKNHLECPSLETPGFYPGKGGSRRTRERLKVCHCHQSLFPDYNSPQDPPIVSLLSDPLQTEVRHTGVCFKD